jgi:hypothetical protein
MRPVATLDRLCADLGPELIEVVVAPRGLGLAVLGVALHDPTEPAAGTVGDGDIVLAVGAGFDDRAAATLLREAAALGAVALLAKRRGTPSDELVSAARETGTALLTTDPEASWGQLYDLINTSMAADLADALPHVVGAGPSDLFALADATAALAGGPVTIEDARSRVLAFSHGGQDVDEGRMATILGRRVPDAWMRELRRHDALDRLLDSHDPIRIELDGLRARRAIAIRAGTTVLGSIWVASPSEDVSPATDDALRAAAGVAALHLLRRRATDDLQRRLQGGRLQALLNGDGTATEALEDLELAGAAGFAVAAIETSERAADDGRSVHEQLVDLLVIHLRAYRRQAEATVIGDRVYLLAACATGADRDGLRRCLQDGLARARQALGTTFRAGLSAPVGVAADIATARRSADQALALGDRDQRVVGFEEVHAQAIVADIRGFLADRGVRPSPDLQALIDHDREHGSEYVETLRVFLAAVGDSPETARRLGIHVNTVRYRVRRVLEITGLRLEDDAARFALELQLRTLLLDPGPSGGAVAEARDGERRQRK